ncbi:MAG: 50S ribosomal protein L23 [Thermoplasmatota archaeon]
MPHRILLHPVVTEKTLHFMEGEVHGTKLNSIVFIVKEGSTKPEIKKAFEDLFEVKVERVNIKHTRTGKQAIIKLTDDYSADDVGMRIGIF